MSRSAWVPRWGDINGLVALLIDNAAALVLLYLLLAAPGYQINRFTPSFVLTWLVPGTVAGVLLGGVLYAWLAKRLGRRTGRHDVTAMPVGLDTPSVFAMSLFVLLPALAEGRDLLADRGLEEFDWHHLASVFAWQVGAVVLVAMGLFKTVLAPLGQLVRRWVPRAALLGALAAIALALIAFLPVARHIAPAPVVGLPVLAIILVTLLARRGTYDAVPGALLGLGVGLVIVLISSVLGTWLDWDFVPLPEARLLRPGPVQPLPAEVWTAGWWEQVCWSALQKLPLALPFALFTLVGGVQCAESSAAAGDDYGTRGVLLVQGAASTIAGLLGGVVQTTPYFGHPAYKKMGSGWAYVVLGTLVLALAGYFGWFAPVFESVPGAVLFPVIVYVGLRTIAHSFEVTPPRDYAALALAAVPVLAYLISISTDEMFAGRTPNPAGVVLLQALRCLGNGFILTSLFWAIAVTAILDGRPGRGVVALALAAACSLVGLMHSSLPGGPLAWPHEVYEQLASGPNTALRFQSPYHWAAAYVLAAIVLLIDSWIPSRGAAAEDQALKESARQDALHPVSAGDIPPGEVPVP
jgi:AGZA family xanthine/uracil permease-like MFS transporter